jgi:non-haem Fe2+, alpha-ketoglutarate-dependent halogenase
MVIQFTRTLQWTGEVILLETENTKCKKIPASLAKDFFATGVVCPVDILSPSETAFYRSQLESFLDRIAWRLDAVNRHKPHLYLKWANELGRHPQILNAIKPILGPDILLWYSVVFVKPAHNNGEVPWHQDSTYWALNRDEGVTVWVALSDVNESNGCVEYLPGSHLLSNVKHSIDNTENNMLARGQKIVGFNPTETQKMILRPGQASLHHPSVLHTSKANLSSQPRLGIAFRYIPASNFPRTLTWMRRSATLVCGEDKLQKFTKDAVPTRDYDPVGLKAHRKSVRIAAIHTLFGDTSRTSWKKILDLAPILLTKKTLQYFRRFGFDVEQSRDS